MKVILTKGLPGSGKSTWAKEQLKREPGRYKIINKDGLRAMLDDGVFSPENERFVLAARDALIMCAVDEGFIPIIDDTNLHEKHEQAIRDLVAGLIPVEIKDFTGVELQVCIERDRQRANPVGEQVIRDMWERFLRKEGTKSADVGWTDQDLDRLAKITPEDLVAASEFWDKNAPVGLEGLLGAEQDRKQ